MGFHFHFPFLNPLSFISLPRNTAKHTMLRQLLVLCCFLSMSNAWGWGGWGNKNNGNNNGGGGYGGNSGGNGGWGGNGGNGGGWGHGGGWLGKIFDLYTKWCAAAIEKLAGCVFGDNNYLSKYGQAFDSLKDGWEHWERKLEKYCGNYDIKKLYKLCDTLKEKCTQWVGIEYGNWGGDKGGWGNGGYQKAKDTMECIMEWVSPDEVCGIDTKTIAQSNSVDIQDIKDAVCNSECMDCFGEHGDTACDALTGMEPYLEMMAEAYGTIQKQSLMAPPISNDHKGFIEISIANSTMAWALAVLLICNAAIVGYFVWNRKADYKPMKVAAYDTEDEI